ncbi:MAG: hypothetical protein AAGI28_11710 [Pseudomonadota bacterium]
MRVLIDMVDRVAAIVRFAAGAMVLVIFTYAIVVTFGASYVAPKVAENMGDRATRFGEMPLEEARVTEREHRLAQDGWGYGSTDNDSSRKRESESRSRDRRNSDIGDWGNNAQ